jgi:hypothetical protein
MYRLHQARQFGRRNRGYIPIRMPPADNHDILVIDNLIQD